MNYKDTSYRTSLFCVYFLFIMDINVCQISLCRGEMELNLTQTQQPEVPRDSEAVDYLERYGYLSRQSDDLTDNITHSDVDKDHAIRTFQRFANVQETGRVDDQTSGLMSQPRCGFLDILPNTDRTLPLKLQNPALWTSKIVKWKISSFSKKLSITQQRQALQNSFHHWSSNSGLVIEETLDDDADIDIKFVTGDHGDGKHNAFDGQGKSIAHAFLPPGGDVHFDDDENWTFHNNNGTEFEMTAIHELGHALGLIHSTVRESIMSPFYRKYEEGFELHPIDVMAIQDLYGTPLAAEERAPAEILNITSPATTNRIELTTKKKITDICKARFDAICGGKDGHINLFVGRKVYKLYSYCSEGQTCIVNGYPKPIRAVFKKGPRSVQAAAYIPDVRKQTYLFKGRKIWRYTGSKLDKGFPIKLTRNDLPFKPSAAYVQKTPYADYQLYLFSKIYFWELNLYTNKMVNSVFYIDTYWNRMPKNPDAMLQNKDGNIYVFKGKHYRKYDHRRGIVSRKKLKAPAWIGRQCGFGDAINLEESKILYQGKGSGRSND